METVTENKAIQATKLDYLDFSRQKKRHGGWRPGAGRPKGSIGRKRKEQERMEIATYDIKNNHLSERHKITYIDKNGKIKSKWRTNFQLMLDILVKDALSSEKFRDRLMAIREYLDRTIGKPGYAAEMYPSEKQARKASDENYRRYLQENRDLTANEILVAIKHYQSMIEELREKLKVVIRPIDSM